MWQQKSNCNIRDLATSYLAHSPKVTNLSVSVRVAHPLRALSISWDDVANGEFLPTATVRICTLSLKWKAFSVYVPTTLNMWLRVVEWVTLDPTKSLVISPLPVKDSSDVARESLCRLDGSHQTHGANSLRFGCAWGRRGLVSDPPCRPGLFSGDAAAV